MNIYYSATSLQPTLEGPVSESDQILFSREELARYKFTYPKLARHLYGSKLDSEKAGPRTHPEKRISYKIMQGDSSTPRTRLLTGEFKKIHKQQDVLPCERKQLQLEQKRPGRWSPCDTPTCLRATHEIS